MKSKSVSTTRGTNMKWSLLAAAGVMLAAATSPLSALAGSTALTPHAVEVRATLHGVASVATLAASPANRAMLAASNKGKPVAMPLHRYPDGSQFGARVGPLPRFATSNAAVRPPALLARERRTGFTGIYEGSNLAATGGELEPPDQGLAVNNGEILEIVNNTLQVFNTSGGALSSPLANATFFGTGTTYNLSDPHAVFDATTQRWFVEELMYSGTFDGFAVAISQTSDPLGSYYVYYIDAATSGISACGGSCLPDYPQVGFDKNGFYIAADLFSNSSGGFVDTGFYALPKTALEAGAGFGYVYFLLPDFVVQPSIPAPGAAFVRSAGGTEFALTARNIYDGSTNVRVWAISNTSKLSTSPTSLTAHGIDIAAESYGGTVAQTQPNVVGPYGQSVGATSAPKIDGGYNSFGGGVKLTEGGNLYAALATGSTDGNGLARDIIAWFQVKPTATSSGVTGSIVAQGYVVPPNGYSMSYPDFALSAEGTGVIGASITNTSGSVAGGYPSTSFINFNRSATNGSIYVVGAGNTSDDGFTGYGGSGVGRWGDYGGGMVDPVTGYLYVANEFIPNAATYPRGTYANWGTFITQVHH
ncbi:MAG: hypothetical protein ABI306_10255 [Caulobacteraceae bacterium]